MATRGVLYIHWGEAAAAMQKRSEASLRQYHPDLPVHAARLPDSANMLSKSRMMQLSPFEETLYLDVDTVVMGALDFAFAKAARFGLACCINENPWAARCIDPRLKGDIIEYNTGVVFFTRQAAPLFQRWATLAGELDSRVASYITVDGKHEGQLVDFQDQASFACAVEELGAHPFVLPLNWNFRPRWHATWYGPIKIWHDHRPPTQPIYDWNADQTKPGRVFKYSQQFLRRGPASGAGSPSSGQAGP